MLAKPGVPGLGGVLGLVLIVIVVLWLVGGIGGRILRRTALCGFGIATIFEVAIFIIVVLAIIALINATGWLAGFVGPPGAPYGNIIRIVVGAVIAILILLFLWKMAECAGSWAASAGRITSTCSDSLDEPSRRH